MTAGSGWSDTLRIEAGMLEERAFIPLWIRANFAPWQAILLAVCPIQMCIRESTCLEELDAVYRSLREPVYGTAECPLCFIEKIIVP